MKCPYCNEEMKKGYIQCRDGVTWTPKKQLIASLSSLGNGSIKISNIEPDYSSAVYAFHCEGCKKIIIEYN